jgi:T4 RnlA family RNA ligase
MNYEFPHITNIQDVLDAIEGRAEFVVKHDVEGGYKVVNYLVNFEDTFPPVKTRRDALIRECRGITFDDKTGKVLARKYHKFFNLNERAETRHEVIDFAEVHDILEKLDGSMLTPLLVKGSVRWNTKMGLTGIALPVDEWVSRHKNYDVFARERITAGQTPIFEWCSRIQRIVIDYPEDRLVLTAVRDNVTGKYVDYLDMLVMASIHDIDTVKCLPGNVENIQKFMADAQDLLGEEGYVIRFKNGHMIKVKGAWYCQLHKTLDHLRHEKDVIRLVVDEKIDDAKAFLPADLVTAVDGFAEQIFKTAHKVASDVYWEAQASYDNFNGGKKKFADHVNASDELKKLSGFLFKAWDNLDEGEDWLYKYILDHILKGANTQNKVNEMRYLLGPKSWHEFGKVDLEE